MNTCDFCDYVEIHGLADVLVTKLTEISRSKYPSTMDPAKMVKLMERFRQALFLDRPVTDRCYKYSRAHVTKLLDDYMKSSRKLVHLFNESADKRKVVIDRIFSANDALAMAIQLIQRFDSDHAFHCDKPNCGADMETCQCPFVHVHCVNEGCKLQFSRHLGPPHDAVCPFKLLTCSCGMSLLRSEFDSHSTNDCVERIVPCPYSGLGCSTIMKFKDVPAHNGASLPHHFNMVLNKINFLSNLKNENVHLKAELAAVSLKANEMHEKYEKVQRARRHSSNF